MNRFMIRKLMEKDWYMCRPGVYLNLVLGFTALITLLIGNGITFFIGAILLDLALVIPMVMVVFSIIVNEYKYKTFSFVFSLPIGNREYAISKIVLSLGCYLVIWIFLYSGAIAILLIRIDISNSIIPYFTMLCGQALMYYCIILAAAIAFESELITGMVFGLSNIILQCSISMGTLFSEKMRESVMSPTILWNDAIVTIISIEITVSVVCILSMFYFQLRKKDFL